jgi:hypothetical protein
VYTAIQSRSGAPWVIKRIQDTKLSLGLTKHYAMKKYEGVEEELHALLTSTYKKIRSFRTLINFSSVFQLFRKSLVPKYGHIKAKVSPPDE